MCQRSLPYIEDIESLNFCCYFGYDEAIDDLIDDLGTKGDRNLDIYFPARMHSHVRAVKMIFFKQTKINIFIYNFLWLTKCTNLMEATIPGTHGKITLI
jgi:hypothetical protein